MFKCSKKDTCGNYPVRCSFCGANSDIYNHYPAYQHKDIVRVVRCKDCKYLSKNGIGCTNFRGLTFVNKNDYCSHGVRKEGETE